LGFSFGFSFGLSFGLRFWGEVQGFWSYDKDLALI